MPGVPAVQSLHSFMMAGKKGGYLYWEEGWLSVPNATLGFIEQLSGKCRLCLEGAGISLNLD